MIKEQKELLAKIAAAHRAAHKLYTAGVKIGGVVQKLRNAGDELDARVRNLERAEKTKVEIKADAEKGEAE